MPDRLRKSATDKMLFGVCGGLGEYLDIDPTLVRAGFVVLAFASGVGVVLYIVLAILMPKPTPETLAETGHGDEGTRGDISARPAAPDHEAAAHRRRNTVGFVLVIVGVVFLLVNLNLLWWWRWDILWPLLLILVGAVLLFGRFARRP